MKSYLIAAVLTAAFSGGSGAAEFGYVPFKDIKAMALGAQDEKGGRLDKSLAAIYARIFALQDSLRETRLGLGTPVDDSRRVIGERLSAFRLEMHWALGDPPISDETLLSWAERLSLLWHKRNPNVDLGIPELKARLAWIYKHNSYLVDSFADKLELIGDLVVELRGLERQRARNEKKIAALEADILEARYYLKELLEAARALK